MSHDPFSDCIGSMLSFPKLSTQVVSSLKSCLCIVDDSKVQHEFNKPMPWIGIYIAVASLFCALAMLADLLHGFRYRKLWFPCKYFTLNAASLTVIAVAMKLPVDLNNPMPGQVDQVAKLGSMAFMCTMMANFMPSLAAMDNKELSTNIIALGILVITTTVNFCIEIKTGVVSDAYFVSSSSSSSSLSIYSNRSTATLYVMMILFLLILLVSSALTIPTFKSILESKYQVIQKTALNNQEPLHTEMSTFERLKHHVSRCWVMAETGSPQFMMAISPICSAVGVICFACGVTHSLSVIPIFEDQVYGDYQSDYKWSMLFILVAQAIGVAVGTIAPVSRCFAALSFKLSINWSSGHMKVFKVESYWTQKLSDWKQSRVPCPIGARKFKVLAHNAKNLILSLHIGFQSTIVALCKILRLIPIFIVIFLVYLIVCLKSLKAIFLDKPTASDVQALELGQQNTNEDLSHYVLQLEDEMELAKRTLKGISKSLNRLILRAEKQQPSNLIAFLQRSTGFEGVEKFDSAHVPNLLSEEPPICWSLTVVTLTSIIIALPNIQNKVVDNLLRSVSEGIMYVGLVEDNLNVRDDFVNIRRATKRLWLEIEVFRRWLGNNLQNGALKRKSSKEILEWLGDTAEKIGVEFENSTKGGANTDMSIAANSMYRITRTILLCSSDENGPGEEQLFEDLSTMIADILSACLSNLPKVITSKCYASAIEKREDSIKSAAEILGETKKIIHNLQGRELPNLDPHQMAFLEEWRAFLQHVIP